jgi:hypothetical protein
MAGHPQRHPKTLKERHSFNNEHMPFGSLSGCRKRPDGPGGMTLAGGVLYS